MAQDWFTQNAPAKRSWFDDNAPEAERPLTRERASRAAGQLEIGNIDLRARPTAKNADGSISTVRSLGVNIDGREVLIPTVTDDGRIVSDDEAIDLYRRTGKHLGKFDTPEHATAYAEQLHDAQAQQYGEGWAGHHPDTIGEHPHAKFGRAVINAGRAALDPENLPAVGGVLGGIVGSAVPGAGTVLGGTAGAALFGGLGAAARAMSRSASGRPEPTGEELGLDIVKSGAKEGAAQLVGSGIVRGATAALRGAAPLATKGAERIAARALAVSDKLARKSPGVNIPLEAARVGARISPAGDRALGAEIQVLKDTATNAIADSGAMIRPSDAIAAARALLRDRQALGAVAADDVAAIDDEIVRFIGDDVAVSAEKLNAIKRWLAERARFGAAQVPARAEAQQALTRGAREAINRAVPEAGAANAEMSRLIPVRAAVQAAAQRNATAGGQGLRVSAGGALGALGGALTGDPTTIGITGLAGAVLPRIVGSPNNQMRAASGLYRAGQAMRPLAGAAPVVDRYGNQVAVPAGRAALSLRDALLAALDEGPVDNAGQPIAGASTVRP